MVEGFRRDDSPAVPQLAIPITVPNLVYEAGHKNGSPKAMAVGSLSLIAFFYLLRVGEYTKPKYATRNGVRVRATRTKQFSVGNVGFWKNGQRVPRTSPLSTLLDCDAATLKITNQKNGRMGDTIHQEAVSGPNCPVKALAYRVSHILSHGGSDDNLLCDYYDNGKWDSIVSNDIIKGLQSAASLLNLSKVAIDPDLIGAHSLRAGGAVALRLHGYDDTTIMKFGRWTSTTFLMYIHNQIAHLSQGISQKMSRPLPFINIAAI